MREGGRGGGQRMGRGKSACGFAGTCLKTAISPSVF